MNDFLSSLANADSGKLLAVIGICMWLDIRGTVKELTDSVKTLISQMAVVIERVDSHERRIEKLEDK